jgi:PAS domain S-box-containing protein
MELSAVNFSTKVFWVKFQAIWHLPAAAVITCFVFQYAGLGRWLTHRNCILLFLVPVLCVVLMVTNGSHHLIWAGFRMNGYVTVLSGRLFWLFISYGILLGIFNLAVMFWLAICSPGHRWPVAIMVVSQIIAHVGYSIDKLGTDLFGPGEAVLLVVGVVCSGYALAFLRFHAIDPVAAARKAVLRQMSEGLLVVDLQGCIVDVNPMAASILGLTEKNLCEKRFTEVMPIDEGLFEQLRNKKIGQADITLGKGTSARHYNLKLTTLRGRRNEVIGHLLLIHDVTEEKRAQSRILEEQSVVATFKERERLARELHDGIGQILGYVSIQAQTVIKWINDGNHEKAESLLGRLVEVAKDAHTDVRESIIDLRSTSDRKWFFIPTLKNYIDKFQSNYGIRTELSLSEGIGENTFDPMVEFQLFRVIQEALTNSRKHSGAHTLRVIMGLDGNMACITITDDGDGFDADQLKSSGSSHFGLIFMQERMEQIGGSLKIDSIPGGGTVLSLDVPIREKHEGT